jgi:hypothetical protein
MASEFAIHSRGSSPHNHLTVRSNFGGTSDPTHFGAIYNKKLVELLEPSANERTNTI